jgi:hypothetical protein
MTLEEFMKKWRSHLESGHYGLDIEHSEVITYLDEKFTQLEEEFPHFTFSQIKMKFGSSRVYMEPSEIRTKEIEEKINNIIKND